MVPPKRVDGAIESTRGNQMSQVKETDEPKPTKSSAKSAISRAIQPIVTKPKTDVRSNCSSNKFTNTFVSR